MLARGEKREEDQDLHEESRERELVKDFFLTSLCLRAVFPKFVREAGVLNLDFSLFFLFPYL